MTVVPRLSDFGTRMLAVERAIGVLQRTSRLSNASIGSGGLRIYDGGSILLEGGGDMIVRGGGHLAFADGGILTMQYPGGAAFIGAGSETSDTGIFSIEKPNGFDLFVATVTTGTAKGQVRIGQEIDPDPPDIFLEGTNVGIGSNANLVLNPGGSLRLLNIPEVAGSANVRIAFDGSIGFIASRRELKDDIRPLDIDPDDVLQIEPVTFVSKAEPEAGRMTGVIAEQVRDVGGLDSLLTTDPDGDLAGFDYSALPLALLQVVKRQEQQIADLTARLAAIEGNTP